MVNTTKACIPGSSYKPYLKPYWSRELSDLNKTMKSARQEWLRSGCLRFGPSFVKLKSLKRLFRFKHRKAAENYFHKLYDDIDRNIELDQEQFWCLVNSKRKTLNTSPGAEIDFHGNLCRDSSSVMQGRSDYFRNLYSFDDNPVHECF